MAIKFEVEKKIDKKIVFKRLTFKLQEEYSQLMDSVNEDEITAEKITQILNLIVDNKEVIETLDIEEATEIIGNFLNYAAPTMIKETASPEELETNREQK